MGFLGKFFGSKKSEKQEVALVEQILQGILDRSNLGLSYEVKIKEDNNGELILIELFGEDEELLLEKEAQLLDSLQLYLKRALQHHYPEAREDVIVDCGGFREQANKELVDLAEKLKGIALDKKKSVYLRALAPKDRKVVHQYLASDARVKSRSIGEGLYKKIKIYPIRPTA